MSLTAPGVEQLTAADVVPLARAVNGFLADAIRRHPARFATLPVASPDAGAAKLERIAHGNAERLARMSAP